MQGTQKKQMIYISVRDAQTSPALYYEIEDYQPSPDRQTFASVRFHCEKESEIYSDQEKIEALGFSLALGFTSPRNLSDTYGRTWALAVYSDPACSQGIKIIIDEEPYQTNVMRRFCTLIKLETLDKEKTLHNPQFCTIVANTLLNLLLPENKSRKLS